MTTSVTLSNAVRTTTTTKTGPRHSVRQQRASSRGVVTKLMYAAQQGDVEAVRRITRLQPDSLYLSDRSGKTALHYCCTSDNICAAQAADVLVMAASDLVDGRDDDGFTPLHLAVIAGNIQLVTFLLANNADVNAVDNEKHTVVHWATVCGETAALRAVLAAGAPVSTPDVHGGYPLHYAAQMCGGDSKESNLGMQVLQTLLTHSDVVVSVTDGDKRQPLLWAASAGSAKAVLALIRAGAAVEAADKDGLTALHCAASRGHTDCIDTLLTLCGSSPDVIDSNGCTALHYAVTLGHADATALLLAHGADPNRQDRKGRSPAHCGCAKGQFETVKMIAAHNANLWLRNARGDLPLHEAAGSGRRELVKWLLEMRPSQVNARNNDGRCPLHMAALNDNSDMCKILLDTGAQVNPILRTSKNAFMTPLDCALQRGFRSTAKYLQLHGGIPANRLNDPNHNQANSALSLQIREDVTFWGASTSDSERENGHDEKNNKQIYRKRMTYKYERKKHSGSDAEFAKSKIKRDKSKESSRPGSKIENSRSASEFSKRLSSRKPSGYSSGIVINGKTEINILQGKEIILEKKELVDKATEITKSLQQNTLTSEDSIAAKTKSRPRSAKYSAKCVGTSARSRLNEPVLIDQATNTVIEDEKQILLPDQQSLISNTSEDVDEQKSMIVEAAVHAPPKEFENVEKVPKETGDIIGEEEDGHESVNENKSVEIAAEETKIIDAGEIVNSNEVSKIEVVLSRDDKDLTETKEEENVQQKSETEVQEIVEDQNETVDVSNERSEVVETLHPEPIPEIQNEENKIKLTSEEENNTVDVKTEETANIESVIVEKETSNEEKTIVNSLPVDKSDDVEDVTEPKIEETVFQANEEDALIAEKILQDLPKENEKNDVQSQNEEPGRNSKNSLEKQSTVTLSKSTTIQLSDQQSEDVEKTIPTKRNKKRSSRSKDLSTEDSTKSSKSKIMVQDSIETAINRKSTEDYEFYDSSTSSDSTSSSSTSRKTHRSFRVLDDVEAKTDVERKGTTRTRKLSASRKNSRSRSEELRSRRQFVPSKIPIAGDRFLDRSSNRKVQSSLDARVPSLPNIHQISRDSLGVPVRSESNMSAPILTSTFSDDNEQSASGDEEEDGEVGGMVRKKKLKKRAKTRESHSAGSDYESSNVVDSGFEPSPRSTRIPRLKNMSDRGVNMTSVTQSIQSNIRRYHLERKIFQQLLELKRLQIRSGQHNEAILVKRAIEAYHQSCASTVGAGRYTPSDFTFKSFEKFLYQALRKLQKNGTSDYLRGLPETANPLHCTQSTHRCMHATHAYTGIPCAAYLPKMDHHSIPKIGFNNVNCKPGTGGFLPTINRKKAVTLELSHGSDKQIISLPTDRLDHNKRYYVTFTVKGQDPLSSENTEINLQHRHSKSD